MANSKKTNSTSANSLAKLKILSPAGSWDSLRAGVEAGADSVYFGIANFNMRASAARNFTFEDLPEISKYCKKNKVETCLTVNTLMYDSDLETMRKVIDSAVDSGIDAVIVADISALLYANEKNIPAYISTQLSVSNIESVRFFAKYSDRIILARELSLEQVSDIINQIKKEKITGPSGRLVEIEIFGHGALCVAVSGRCGMSLFCYGTSANKGTCAQPCRRAYKVTDIDTGKELVIDNNYVLSPKDLCTIGLMPQIIKAGVSILKIEGRGRPPEYVETVVSTYKEAINSIYDGTYSTEKVEIWNSKLKTVFNRGLSSGLYMGRDIDEWAGGSGNQSTMERILLGKVIKYFSDIKVAHIKISTKEVLNNGEECLIIGSKTGLVRLNAKDMMLDEKKFDHVSQGMEFTMKVPQPVRKGDEVYVFRAKN